MARVPFGAGVALTLDESALLLKLDDVYWTEEGIVSVQISLAVVSMLSAVLLALRMLRRGERVVLDRVVLEPGVRRRASAVQAAAALEAVAGLGPDDLFAAGADADEHDRHAEEVGDEVEVLARGLGQVRPRAAAA